MEILPLFTVIAVIVFLLRKRDQRKRIALLGRHLGNYQIEKLMETVTDGYLRALGEADPERREQIWHHLDAAEVRLSEQFSQFSVEFARLDAPCCHSRHKTRSSADSSVRVRRAISEANASPHEVP